MSGRRHTWSASLFATIGILVMVGGGYLLVKYGTAHTICTSALVSGTHACRHADDRFYEGCVALVVGGLVFLASVIESAVASIRFSMTP